MVVQPKKHDPKNLRVFVDFWWINRVDLKDPFPDKIMNEVTSHECYSFIDRFWGYNQVPIAKRDQHKTTFVYEFGHFTYKVIPFGLKNALVLFYIIVIKAFQEFLCKTMVVYFDEWIVYNLLKEHVKWLHLMLECCRQIKLASNIKKFIFDTPIGILLGNAVCKEGIKVYLEKIKVILNLKPL